MPITMPPIGRVTKPAPNVASDSIRLPNWLSVGKEGVADLDGEEAVGDEVVELEHVADGHGERAAADEGCEPAPAAAACED